jgi:hypothetical protein
VLRRLGRSQPGLYTTTLVRSCANESRTPGAT